MPAIRDGTDLAFSTRPGRDDLHATLAVSGTGLPLGVLGLGFDRQETLSKEEEERRTRRRLEG